MDKNYLYESDYFVDITIYLINGDKIETMESDDLPYEETIMYAWENSKDKFLKINCGMDSVAMVPKENIVFIVAGSVHRG